MDFDFGYSFGLPSVLSPFARLIPTLAGTQYGTIDTPVVFAGDFEIEVEFATTSTGVFIVFYGSAGAITDFFTFADDDTIRVKVNGTTLASVIGAAAPYRDGKVYTAIIRRVGSTVTADVDGIEFISGVAAGNHSIGEIASYNSGALPLIGQLLSIKFNNITTGEIRNFVFDSGSTTAQYARGSTTDKITLTAFTAAVWNRYTLQRNISHDAGTIVEAWVGDNIVVNGQFNTDTDWIKGTGWTIASGVASCDGSQASATNLAQTLAHVIGDVHLVESTISLYSEGSMVQTLGGVNGVAKSANGTTKEIISPTTAANLNMQGNTTFVGSVDDVKAQHLLEVA